MRANKYGKRNFPTTVRTIDGALLEEAAIAESRTS